MIVFDKNCFKEPICAKSIMDTGVVDPTIESSFKWLVDYIDDNWNDLNSRVVDDSNKQINRENDSMRKRIHKISKKVFFDVESQVPNVI